jgi:hypothetical protein
LNGTFVLQINTRDTASAGVPANTARISVDNARFTIGGFSLTGSISIGFVGGLFRIDIPSGDPLRVRVFDLLLRPTRE